MKATNFLLVVVVSALALGIADAQFVNCKGGRIEVTEDVFGCDGYSNTDTTFVINDPKDTHIISFDYVNTGSYDSVSVNQGSTRVYGPMTGRSDVGSVAVAEGVTEIRLNADLTGQGEGFKAHLYEGPQIEHMINGYTQSYEGHGSGGGFLYFSQDNFVFGSQVAWEVTVVSYKGLKPPTLFASPNVLPNLLHHRTSRDTVADGDTYKATIYYSPSSYADTTNYMGIFMYGTAARIDVTPIWKFSSGSLPSLEKDKLYDKQLSTGGISRYQFSTTDKSTFISFEVARQLPGGYPRLYLRQNDVASDTQYDYMIDTSKQNYITLEISEVFRPKVSNTGLWTVFITSRDKGSILFKASWD